MKTQHVQRHATIKDASIADPETGLITDLMPGAQITFTEEVKPKRKHRQADRHHRHWGSVDFDAMSRLNLTTLEMRIVFLIAANTDRDRNEARLTIGDMALATGSAMNSIYRAVRALRNNNIIEGERHRWRVSVYLLTRGSVDQWEQDTAEAKIAPPVGL